MMAKVGRLAEDYEAVFAWLEAAMQSDRQNGSAAAELASLAIEQNEIETAMRALQAVTLLKEPGPMSRAEAHLRQGMIAERRGDRKKAVFLARRALTTEPEYGDAKSFLERLGEGRELRDRPRQIERRESDTFGTCVGVFGRYSAALWPFLHYEPRPCSEEPPFGLPCSLLSRRALTPSLWLPERGAPPV